MLRYHSPDNDRASLSLELAIILPVMIMLVLGSIFLGITYINKSALLDASAIGAMSAASSGTDSAQVRQDIYDELDSRFLTGRDSIDVKISYIDDVSGQETYALTQKANVFELGMPEVGSPGPALPGQKIKVELTFANYVLNIPFISGDPFDMRGTSVSRNANP